MKIQAQKIVWILQNNEIPDEIFELCRDNDVWIQDAKGDQFQVLDLGATEKEAQK